ncbi:MAG TPA: response regulator transcription factor [Oscillospiraceae bacterium]|nr:response regulator transcription factor [Oscillospiraceae bacterium]
MANILIVEDSAELRRLMRIYLRRAGYEVYEAENGAAALDVMEHASIHLIVMDLMMPVMDGYELTAEIRGANLTIPVLIVSAKDTLDDKREGFRRGADDYMTKPINMEEMLLRIEALLRRCNMMQESVTEIGGCTLNSDALSVSDQENTIPLRQKEFLLLRMLLSYPNKIFSRQNLMDEIWGYDSDSDPRTVDTHVKRLREKLLSFTGFEIQTVRGLGYRAVLKER